VQRIGLGGLGAVERPQMALPGSTQSRAFEGVQFDGCFRFYGEAEVVGGELGHGLISPQIIYALLKTTYNIQ
jgi:hypothetical protein